MEQHHALSRCNTKRDATPQKEQRPFLLTDAMARAFTQSSCALLSAEL